MINQLRTKARSTRLNNEIRRASANTADWTAEDQQILLDLSDKYRDWFYPNADDSRDAGLMAYLTKKSIAARAKAEAEEQAFLKKQTLANRRRAAHRAAFGF